MRVPRMLRASGILLVAGFAACSDSGGAGPDPQATGVINGRVMEGANAVGAVQLQLAGPVSRTTTSNAAGEYSFTALSAGSYTVALTPPAGYQLAAGQQSPRSVAVGTGQQEVNWTLVRTTGGTAQDVVLSGSSFTPNDITIAAGTTIRWVVSDGVHTVTPNNAAQAGVWADRELAGSQSFEHTFNTPGETYNYHCVPHAATGMTGVIRVQ
jgi:plastocyanin